ncbi:hypothetical protein EJ07DRAFT_129919 [Lizonia empirigonia]|nr:hypothetical protein EJ07DRAFT_129919 [Lizonia empirigonia]
MESLLVSGTNRLQCLCTFVMANYVDASSQTEWAGLMQKNIVRPDALFTPYPATSTPPDEPLTKKGQCVDDLPSISPSEQRGQPQTPPPAREQTRTMSTSPLLSRRQNRPSFVPHIDLPSPEIRAIATLDDEVPVSPPPSALVLSPVPEANKRFAGHTPLFPRSPSPDTPRKHEDADKEPQLGNDSQSTTPREDVGLTGPLTLAPNPGDGSQDTILLSALDLELSRIAQEQQRVEGAAEDGQPLSRQGSADSRTSEVRPVDGVTLKKTVPLNFGAPLGQV